ncbi:hypothetical protein LR48_Vigan01g146800 [Vigna angularis]|uniref:Uncharacterized protein n=1 Tax=Phaseolus angularis TaxID=3914 RepID=A0A0L9TN71_PHAAN|nr:hypothetical protein LR48_Vigan01g146800 [Vigna angularis]
MTATVVSNFGAVAGDQWRRQRHLQQILAALSLQFQFLSKFSPKQYGYINDSEWNDLNNEWYDTPQDHYLEPPFKSTFMPPPVQQYESQQYDAPAQITPQPSTSKPTLQKLLEQMTMQNLKFKQESMKIQQETQAAMQNLSDQIGQMTTLAPEENAEDFEDQAKISSSSEPGRPPSSSHTLAIFKEEEVSIPQFDYSVDCDDDRYANDYIVVESDFNFSSVHDENRFLLSHSNVYSPCTEHESESMINIACNLEIDSCYEDLSKVQPITLGLGVIPLHEISAVPHCTIHVAGGTYKFDQHTPTVENKGADTDSSKINMHLLNPLSNNICCLDPAVEDISLLDQIWRMKQFFLKISVLDPEEDISLQIQNWQLPP